MIKNYLIEHFSLNENRLLRIFCFLASDLLRNQVYVWIRYFSDLLIGSFYFSFHQPPQKFFLMCNKLFHWNFAFYDRLQLSVVQKFPSQSRFKDREIGGNVFCLSWFSPCWTVSSLERKESVYGHWRMCSCATHSLQYRKGKLVLHLRLMDKVDYLKN